MKTTGIGTTALISFLPSFEIWERLAKSLKEPLSNITIINLDKDSKRLLDDLPDIYNINDEFSCNDELLLLPAEYVIHDYNLVQDQRRHLNSGLFLHFGMPLKPFHRSYRDQVPSY
jgi:hypothetical protein